MTVKELIEKLEKMPSNAQAKVVSTCDGTKIFYAIDDVTFSERHEVTDKFLRFMDDMCGNNGTEDVVEINFGTNERNDYNF